MFTRTSHLATHSRSCSASRIWSGEKPNLGLPSDRAWVSLKSEHKSTKADLDLWTYRTRRCTCTAERCIFDPAWCLQQEDRKETGEDMYASAAVACDTSTFGFGNRTGRLQTSRYSWRFPSIWVPSSASKARVAMRGSSGLLRSTTWSTGEALIKTVSAARTANNMRTNEVIV